MAWTIHKADNMSILRGMAPNSIDAFVLDPPYGLSSPPDMLAMLQAWLEVGYFEAKGRGFMGQKWDATVPQPIFWREVFRVLKPGGHVVSFGGARMYDLLVLAVRLAGFEIRDQLLWIYGTGFPKSERDITGAMDRRRRNDPRPVCRWLRAQLDARGLQPAALDDLFGKNGMGGHWCARDDAKQPAVPSVDQWLVICQELALDFDAKIGDLVLWLNRRKGQAGEAWRAREIVGEHDKAAGIDTWRRRLTNDNSTPRAGKVRGGPTSPEAEAWVGWAMNLAPAHEPILLARKPFAGPAFANVIEHGCGALNIGACRLAYDGAADLGMTAAKNPGRDDKATTQVYAGDRPQQTVNAAGRWPKNVLLGQAAAAELGERSRFFYCDKASTREREAGLEAFAIGEAWTDGRACQADYPSLRGATDRRNVHETVKPIDVMRWLVRLVTPIGGTVVDPFCGSGTTGIASILEGFDFVGIELDGEDRGYADIARRRCQAAEDGAFEIIGEKSSPLSPTARLQGRLFEL